MVVSSSELIAKAKGLVPLVSDRAEETENLRSVPAKTIEDFRSAGFFEILKPKKHGGYEMPPQVLYEVIAEISRGCASSGWVLGVLAVHNWEAGLLCEQAQEDIWGENPDALISSSYAPMGKVERVEGGYQLSGSWPFSSGCDHAEWAFLGGLMAEKEGDAPTLTVFCVPKADFEIDDDWHVVGLAGTGSKSVVVKDAFVPAHRSHAIAESCPIDDPTISPLYKMNFGSVFMGSIASPVIGVAQGVLDQYLERVKVRRGAYDGAKFVDDPQIHMRIAEAKAAISTTQLRQRSNSDEIMDYAQRGEIVPMELRAKYLWDATNGVRDCVRAVDLMFEANGARGTFLNNPIQRAFRDAHVISVHAGLNNDVAGRNFGRLILGMDNQVAMLG